MLLLTRAWAEGYVKEFPNVSFYLDGGGTATGALALANGETDICAASRPLRPDEISLLAKKYNKIGIAFMVAKDALSVYVHRDNPVKDLTLTQIKEIFTGKLTNWNQLGGMDMPIIVTSRYPSSGTYYYFQEHVLEGNEYTPHAELLATTEQMTNFIAGHINSIGYGGFGWGTTVAHCKIEGIEATETNVINGTYPIARYLYLYTVNIPMFEVKHFIDWVMDKQNQYLVKKAGYFPIWTETGNEN